MTEMGRAGASISPLQTENIAAVFAASTHNGPHPEVLAKRASKDAPENPCRIVRKPDAFLVRPSRLARKGSGCAFS